jgi:hypothetical protein
MIDTKKFLLLCVTLSSLCYADRPKEVGLSHHVGRFEMVPYPTEFKEITPTSRFDLIECYVVFSNKTNEDLHVTFYHKKDLVGVGQTSVAIPEGQLGTSLVRKKMITGFALPEFKWHEERGMGFGKNKLVEVLMHAPVAGFSLSKTGESIPEKPQVLLPKNRECIPTFFYDIVCSKDKRGFRVQRVSGRAR